MSKPELYAPPTQWNELPSGELLRAHVQKQMDELLWCRFGFHLLTVGALAQTLDYSVSPVRLHCGVSSTGGQVRAQEHQLPIRSDSIDVAVLPLVLDFCVDPHAVLREAQRVLIGDGHLMITGFNPFSLWGARRYLGRRNHALWQSRFLSPYRIYDWLKLLGFEVTEHLQFCYTPPLKKQRWQERLQLMEKIGSKYWPVAGAFYTVCAQKRAIPLTPMRLRQPRLVGLPMRLPQPSRREQAA